jgi:hypothetical protein
MYESPKSLLKGLVPDTIWLANLKAAAGSYTRSGLKNNERPSTNILKLIQEISILVIKCMYLKMCMGCGFWIKIKFDDIIFIKKKLF